MNKIPLQIMALVHNEAQPSSYLVILKEEDGERRLPVVIGSFEAHAIAAAAEGAKGPRPLTHDLFANMLRTFSIQIEEVIISDLRNSVFYAVLVCSMPEGGIFELDSRTSDALALAIRFGCPISTYSPIMEEAGIFWENPSEKGISGPQASSLSGHTEDELSQMLEEALEDEDYERAAAIRDELKQRKSN
ncbi:MAG: bifunctional nuclease family protein [Haliscomenobacter sp.]|nr:bifunctional nuclease family protein [Haliscomenobacter sp.]MBK7477350.1 bifunctional nuclease family protein [Haliscomenobacter sp.]MBK8880081.1 bifunctional nuclease family protein [Haliscomenobacter sp.]